jgi:hypothetical protein
VPALLAGTPHGARVYRTVDRAEAGIGAAIWLPSPVPPALSWPPDRIDVWPGPPVSLAVRFGARKPGGPGLVLFQSIGGRQNPPDALLPAAQGLLTVGEVPIGRHLATLTRALAPGGQLLHDLTWDQGDRRLVLRYEGPVEDLLQAARSLERIHP